MPCVHGPVVQASRLLPAGVLARRRVWKAVTVARLVPCVKGASSTSSDLDGAQAVPSPIGTMTHNLTGTIARSGGRWSVDVIVTRNVRDFRTSPIRAVKPADLQL